MHVWPTGTLVPGGTMCVFPATQPPWRASSSVPEPCEGRETKSREGRASQAEGREAQEVGEV